jgi:glycosyltransferase involved in cell wall biosynthesis
MYILFFSRIDTYTKGLDLLIKAFMEINRNWPDIQLILAGYEFDKAETLISRVPLEVRQRISYAGFVTGDKKTRLIAGAKFIVLPSRHESAPISILEAAACGKALVVSDIPELRFVEEQGFGISFQSGSADGLCEKMKMLLNDTELRERLGSKGRKYAGNYTWDRIAKQFEDALFLNANHSP